MLLRALRSARASSAAATRSLPPSFLLRALSTAEPAAPTHIIRFLDEAGQEQHGTSVEGTVEEGADSSDTHRQLTAITLATLQLDDPVRVNVAKLLPPVPTPPNVFCIGLNYRRHAAEVGMDEPKLPVVFMKASSSVIADGDAIIIPSCASAPDEVDYECELAVIIGEPAKDVTVENALDHVWGCVTRCSCPLFMPVVS